MKEILLGLSISGAVVAAVTGGVVQPSTAKAGLETRAAAVLSAASGAGQGAAVEAAVQDLAAAGAGYGEDPPAEVHLALGQEAEDGESAEPGLGSGAHLQIAPPRTRVHLGQTRRFRAAGQAEAGAWAVVDSSGEGVGSIDTTGLFTARAGGWVIIGLKDPRADTLLSATDTVWVMGGPTQVGRRCGRVFSADDTLASVQFPPEAAARAMVVLLEKRGQNELPARARGRGTAVAIFRFTAVDAETGEDVGGKGFAAKVHLTLHYRDSDIPPGVDERTLLVATFDEDLEEWVRLPTSAIVSVDRLENTITVATEHASYWAVADAAALEPPTAIQSGSWGALKNRAAR
jgi:hypothetical protein